MSCVWCKSWLILIAELPSVTVLQEAQQNPTHIEAITWLKCNNISFVLWVTQMLVLNGQLLIV